MIFDFTPDDQFNFLQAFAGRTGGLLQNATLTLPESLGVGSIRKVRLTADFSQLIHHYQLQEELILRRTAPQQESEMINVLFHLQQPSEPFSSAQPHDSFSQQKAFAIQITSSGIDSQMHFPAGSQVYFTVLSTKRSALAQLLKIKQPNLVVEEILFKRTGFLFYEHMSASMQHSLKVLTTINPEGQLSELRLWIEVQSLLYSLFERLLARNTVKHSPIHQRDAQQVLSVRDAIVADLSIAPNLSQLAGLAGMSTSKLTHLFRQVFGDSIYSCYQKAVWSKPGTYCGKKAIKYQKPAIPLASLT